MTWLKYSRALSDRICLIQTPNWVETILWNIGKIILTSDLFFIKNSQVVLEKSSMNETNHQAPLIFEILEGPHTSVWTKEKGWDIIELLKGYETLWCLAIWNTSQLKSLTSILWNNKGKLVFNKGKDGWSILTWCS